MIKPLFIRFANGESSVLEILLSFQKSSDSQTSESAKRAINNPPDLTKFKDELVECLIDLKKDGPSNEFASFVNNYMESLEMDMSLNDTRLGQNRSQVARVVDDEGPWIEGLICYNLCLYIKAFGLEKFKSCKVCSKFFDHKGKYAVYCTDECKAQSRVAKTE